MSLEELQLLLGDLQEAEGDVAYDSYYFNDTVIVNGKNWEVKSFFHIYPEGEGLGFFTFGLSEQDTSVINFISDLYKKKFNLNLNKVNSYCYDNHSDSNSQFTASICKNNHRIDSRHTLEFEIYYRNPN